MNRFSNGHSFNQAIRREPPEGQLLPLVGVNMARNGWDFRPVLGKLDTGAFRTLLTFKTAHSLGIDRPAECPTGPRTASSATGHRFTYYVHPVMVRIDGATDELIEFPVDAGFSEGIQNNLFGIDWLGEVCIAIDREAIYFLRD